MVDTITKQMVEDYEAIRRQGNYNMFTEGRVVMKMIGITDPGAYMDLLNNYENYCHKYGIKMS